MMSFINSLIVVFNVNTSSIFELFFRLNCDFSFCPSRVYRHSKSLNVAIDFCGQCMGQFELILNQNENNSTTKQEKQTPKRPLNKYNLFVKENYQIIKQLNPHLSSPQIMKQLSEEYKKKNRIDLPDFDKLKL